MSKISIATILSLLLVFPGTSGSTKECQQMTAIGVEGYTNIRSSPQVKAGNIIATWYTGGSLSIVTHRQGWWQIRQPVSGWVSQTQVKNLSCSTARNTLERIGHPAIKQFGKRAILGDRAAAVILVKMSRGLDGETAEIYAETLSNWANKNPRFLVSVLEKQPSYIRQSVLEMIDFGLGSQQSPERQQFESFIERLPPQNSIGKDWRRRSKL